MMKKFIFIFILLFSFSIFSADKEELLFGPEFAFDPGENNTSNGEAMVQLREWMEDHLVNNQPEGSKFKLDSNTFISPNGWEVILTTDPGVIEVKMPPLSRNDYEFYGNDIQDALFVSAYNKGYFPADYLGGGHINLSSRYFKDKPNLFRNFLVDLLNHAELGLGVWNYDTNNAISFSLARQKDWDRVRKLIREYDESDDDLQVRMNRLASQVSSVFSGMQDAYKGFWHNSPRSIRGKYTAINISKVGNFESNTGRIEIRMFRPQKDIDTFIRQITLIEKRVHYLESFGDDFKLDLNPNFLMLTPEDDTFVVLEDDALNPPIDPQFALREYYRYVTEAGEKWVDHQDYIWPEWVRNGSLERFNRDLIRYGDNFVLHPAVDCNTLLLEHINDGR